ncbi:hypothetical protein [Mycobacterium camsae]|uniref:hypothetical protein n=1 Tax=Mycobacterium gordonae TaxID=1778 RepID=UPI001F11BDDB|nr:hypothetical protein [Mycobacterium gordonae]
MQLKSQPAPAEHPADMLAATQAAKTGTVRILTYSPDTLDRDFKAAEASLTGDFLSYYRQFSEQIVAPAARERGVTTSATVVRAGVESLKHDKATILLFINQTTTSNEKPEPTTTSSAVRTSLTNIGGKWLIDTFNPA